LQPSQQLLLLLLPLLLLCCGCCTLQEPEGSGALRSLTSQLTRPPKSQTAWRPVLAMLQLLQDLVPLLGLAGPAGELFAAAAVLRVLWLLACTCVVLCWPCCG
jgi:hypothetical protein